MSHFYDTATEKLVDPWTPGAYASASTVLDRVKSDGNDRFKQEVGEKEANLHMVRAQDRGHRIHRACEIYAQSGGDYELAIAVAGLIDGYWYTYEELGTKTWYEPEVLFFEGFVRWVEVYRVEFIFSEKFLVNHTMRYAGTCDIVAFLTHPKTGERSLWLPDIKTGMTRVKHGLQLKFYKEALVDMVKRSLLAWSYDIPVNKARQGCLYLDAKRASGYRYFKSEYGMLEFKEPLSAIKAHLSVYKWWAKKEPVKQPRDTGDMVWAPEDLQVSRG